MIETNQVDDNDYSLILDEDLNNSREINLRIITRTSIQNANVNGNLIKVRKIIEEQIILDKADQVVLQGESKLQGQVSQREQTVKDGEEEIIPVLADQVVPQGESKSYGQVSQREQTIKDGEEEIIPVLADQVIPQDESKSQGQVSQREQTIQDGNDQKQDNSQIQNDNADENLYLNQTSAQNKYQENIHKDKTEDPNKNQNLIQETEPLINNQAQQVRDQEQQWTSQPTHNVIEQNQQMQYDQGPIKTIEIKIDQNVEQQQNRMESISSNNVGQKNPAVSQYEKKPTEPQPLNLMRQKTPQIQNDGVKQQVESSNLNNERLQSKNQKNTQNQFPNETQNFRPEVQTDSLHQIKAGQISSDLVGSQQQNYFGQGVPTGQIPTGQIPIGQIPIGQILTGQIPTEQIQTGYVPIRSQNQNYLGQQIPPGTYYPAHRGYYPNNQGNYVPIGNYHQGAQIPMASQHPNNWGQQIPMGPVFPNNIEQQASTIPYNQQVGNNIGQQYQNEALGREENLFTENNRHHESQGSIESMERQRILEDHNRGIDLFEAILFKLFRIGDNKRLDLNISIGIISRTLFFFAMISLRDLSNSQVGELIVFILSTLVFHIFIFTERYYIHLSFSITRERELKFKITDSIQLLMIGIYLSIIASTLVEILLLVLVDVNLALSLLQVYYIYQYRKYKPENYVRENGQFWLLFGLFFGCLMMVIIFSSLLDTYSEQLKANSTFYFLVIAACVGSVLGLIGSGYLAFNQKNDWRTDLCKGILCLLYGFNLGLFSLLYGFIVGIIVIGMCLCYAHFWPLWSAVEEVFFKKKKQSE